MIHIHKAKGFKGDIKVRMLKFKERLDVIKSLNIVAKDGEIEISNDNLDKFEKLADIVKKQIHEMDLVHSKSGKEFKCIDDLEYFEEYTVIINDLAGILLNGVSLGNV